MSLAFITHFDHILLHVLVVRGRPALFAHEVGAAAGYRDAGQSFVRSIRTEWNECLHEDDDVAELTGSELTAIKREVPTLGDSAAVLVLFPSGVEKVLGRTHVRGASSLLGFLHARVFSQVVSLGRAGAGTAPAEPERPTEAPAPPDTETAASPTDSRRRFAEYLAIRCFAALVLKYEEDVGEYLNLERQALEVFLGREVELLTPPPAPAAPRRAAA